MPFFVDNDVDEHDVIDKGLSHSTYGLLPGYYDPSPSPYGVQTSISSETGCKIPVKIRIPIHWTPEPGDLVQCGWIAAYLLVARDEHLG